MCGGDFWTAAYLLYPCRLPMHFIMPIFHRLGPLKKDFNYNYFKGQFHMKYWLYFKIGVTVDAFSVSYAFL